jgi:hypothetical protein
MNINLSFNLFILVIYNIYEQFYKLESFWSILQQRQKWKHNKVWVIYLKITKISVESNLINQRVKIKTINILDRKDNISIIISISSLLLNMQNKFSNHNLYNYSSRYE